LKALETFSISISSFKEEYILNYNDLMKQANVDIIIRYAIMNINLLMS